jgi:hypothetical protein
LFIYSKCYLPALKFDLCGKAIAIMQLRWRAAIKKLPKKKSRKEFKYMKKGIFGFALTAIAIIIGFAALVFAYDNHYGCDGYMVGYGGGYGKGPGMMGYGGGYGPSYGHMRGYYGPNENGILSQEDAAKLEQS